MNDEQADIVVTGLGAVSALGVGCAALWDAISSGRSGIRPITRFSTNELGRHVAGIVPQWNGRSVVDGQDLCFSYAFQAAQEAVADAAVGDLSGTQSALVLGTGVGEQGDPPHLITERLADELGIFGPRITISTACTSSTHAVGLGRDLLRAGDARVVLVGGAEALTPSLLAGFSALGVVAPGPCAPFSEPVGMTLGEGAGFLVLETRERAVSRGRAPCANLLGYGLSGDAYHETSPHPRGVGVARAIRGALDDARLDTTEVEYLNAHGTGTANNDLAEWNGIRVVFGEHAEHLPISSTKAHLGHAQAAAGVLELITTLLAMQQGRIPPTSNFTGPRSHAPTDPVGERVPRPASVSYAVCSNSGFGGSNCAVVVGSPQSASAVPRQRSKRLYLMGASALSNEVSTCEQALSAVEAGQSLERDILKIALPRTLRRADPRGLDPASVFLSTAAALALEDAGITLRGGLRDRTGLIVGMTQSSAQSVRSFQQSIRDRGLARASTTAFARTVLNASQGTCAKLLSIRGPQTTVSVGPGSGLFAIVHSAELLSIRNDTDLIVAGGVDELDRYHEQAPDGCEGAACVVIGDNRGEEFSETVESGRAVRVAGWAIGKPTTGLEKTIDRALERAKMDRASVRALFGVGTNRHACGFQQCYDPAVAFGVMSSWTSAAACVAAIAWLRRTPRAAVVIADRGRGSLSSAMVLVGSGDGGELRD